MRVMYFDGKTRRGPMDLPTTATRSLDTGELISVLGPDTMNRCGYYRIKEAAADPGMVIITRSWPDAPDGDGCFVERSIQMDRVAWDAQQAAEQAAAEAEARRVSGDPAYWSESEWRFAKLLFLRITTLQVRAGLKADTWDVWVAAMRAETVKPEPTAEREVPR